LTIALVGLPGAGKSTIGRQLSKLLKWEFADSDVEIEARAGCSIRYLFEQRGEAFFRDLEQQVLGELVCRARTVLATGGGSILRQANREALRQHSQVVYVRTQAEDLARRLRHDANRPLLQGVHPLHKLRELYSVRDPLYREAANFTVDSGRTSVSQLVHLLAMQLELSGVLDP
jgi:shikimate kinase